MHQCKQHFACKHRGAQVYYSELVRCLSLIVECVGLVQTATPFTFQGACHFSFVSVVCPLLQICKTEFTLGLVL